MRASSNRARYGAAAPDGAAAPYGGRGRPRQRRRWLPICRPKAHSAAAASLTCLSEAPNDTHTRLTLRTHASHVRSCASFPSGGGRRTRGRHVFGLAVPVPGPHTPTSLHPYPWRRATCTLHLPASTPPGSLPARAPRAPSPSRPPAPPAACRCRLPRLLPAAPAACRACRLPRLPPAACRCHLPPAAPAAPAACSGRLQRSPGIPHMIFLLDTSEPTTRAQ